MHNARYRGDPFMIRLTIPLALLLGTVASCASAKEGKIYKCKSSSGETFYSQVYDATKCGGGGAEMNPEGIAIKEFERAKTPEELAAEKAIAEQEAEVQRIEEARRKADEVLAVSYPSEDDLERGFREELEAIDSAVETANLSIRSRQKSLAQWLAVAAEAERADKPVPENVSTSITMVREQLQAQRAIVAQAAIDKLRAEVNFKDRLQRYREIKARQEKHLRGQ